MFHRIVQLISFFFFVLALWLIVQEVEKIGVSQLIKLLSDTPMWVIGLAFVFVCADYLVMTLYDVTALEYLHKKLPLKAVFKTACIGFAVSNTAGHAFVSGGAVRYLLYTPLGLTRTQILVLIAFETVTIFMGMGAVYLVATLLIPLTDHLFDSTRLKTFYFVSFIIAVFFFLYYFMIVVRQRRFKIAGVVLKAPTKGLTALQVLSGFCDNFMLSVIFYALLRYAVDVPFLSVFIVFSLAQITAQASQVPGGLGVFSSLFLFLFPHSFAQKGAILASLFLYRAVYFFVPFFLALFYLGFYEARRFWENKETDSFQSRSEADCSGACENFETAVSSEKVNG